MGLEFLDLAKPDGIAEDAASGAEAHLGFGVVEKFAEAKSGLKSQALEVSLGKFGGLALELSELLPEIRGPGANGAGCGGQP